MKIQTATVFLAVTIIVYSDMRQLTQGQKGEIKHIYRAQHM